MTENWKAIKVVVLGNPGYPLPGNKYTGNKYFVVGIVIVGCNCHGRSISRGSADVGDVEVVVMAMSQLVVVVVVVVGQL